ncbi:hydrogen gas-evolving membrane-bound hydrogenase subunit E [Salinarimonas ramus]|uniref:Na(+)/H(+) antiporter subunit A n=1 Tax=Salinarimonas ramus TaxID=690164 RepID=A0A917V4F0_9HYPH|nr:hydrogen gas-evolving membrane-bound hydrogenase subunit E [Salinarimonas ramus]GGK36094.1 Na(+)/H(+) antiporter subunit A [Salinarimonas ramus]
MDLSTVLLVSLVGAVIAPFVAARAGVLAGPLAAALPAILFAWFFAQIDAVGTAPIVQVLPWVPSLGIDLTFRLDGFSLLFALLITGIGTLVTLYAASYMSAKPPFARAQFLLYILLFMTAMLATVTADNLVALFVFWEMTSLLSFLLVGFQSEDAKARKAALQSLLVTAGGGLALLAGIILIGVEAGTFSLAAITANPAPILESPLLPAIVVCVLIGAFTKSAQFPFHFWLPNAMKAPTPASAYLHSATMVKLGVYLLARLDPVFAGAPWVGATLVAFGGVTMLIAALQALRAVELKAVLAFSTVASLGTLVMLIGLDGPVSSVAVVGFILAHALYKATLFFCAGIVIHATHETKLRSLGGLAALLPVTAGATLLASFSMAGLPPFIGFISKEYLFEAKLESSLDTIAVIIGVLVNAVMVAIAGVLALKPFFGRAKKPIHVSHGEQPGMIIGPILLAVTGVAFGLVPSLVSYALITPAAIAIHGAPFEVSFKLWHGFTPMLALSGLVVALGAVLAWFWDPIHLALRRRRVFDEVFSDRGYEVVLERTLALARWSTNRLQNGDLRVYGAVVAASVTGLLAYGLMSGEGPLLPNVGAEPLRPYLVVVCALIVAGCVVAAVVPSLVTAIVAVGLSGYGLALVFLLNGGPDLALTQFSVETLFVVIVTAVLLKLPTVARSSRTPGERWVDATVATCFAACVLVATLWIKAKPFNTQLTEYFAVTSVPEGFGRNVVNVILVDFRALDTFGEIAVVAFAALGAWALLRSGSAIRRTGKGA